MAVYEEVLIEQNGQSSPPSSNKSLFNLTKDERTSPTSSCYNAGNSSSCHTVPMKNVITDGKLLGVVVPNTTKKHLSSPAPTVGTMAETPMSECSKTIYNDDRTSSLVFTPLHVLKNLNFSGTPSVVKSSTSNNNNNIHRSSSPDTDLSTTSSACNSVTGSPNSVGEDQPYCRREPSPQHDGGRTLFGPCSSSRDSFPGDQNHTTADDDSYNNVYVQPHLLREAVEGGGVVQKTRSTGSGVRSSESGGRNVFYNEHSSADHYLDNQGGDNNNNNNNTVSARNSSSSRSSHLLRSRKYQVVDEESPPLSSSSGRVIIERRRQQQGRVRSSNSRSESGGNNNPNAFSFSVVSFDEEDVSISSTENSNLDLSHTSSAHNKKSASKNGKRKMLSKELSRINRTDSSGNGFGGNSNDPNNNNTTSYNFSLKKVTYQKLATTKILVWCLCLVGMISMTMIVMTNHRITKSFDLNNEYEHQDQVKVMFGRERKKAMKRQSKVKSSKMKTTTTAAVSSSSTPKQLAASVVVPMAVTLPSLESNTAELKNNDQNAQMNLELNNQQQQQVPINLHKLSHYNQEDEKPGVGTDEISKNKQSDTVKKTELRKEEPQHHHLSTTTKHHSTTSYHLKKKKDKTHDHNNKHNPSSDHHHHHHHHDHQVDISSNHIDNDTNLNGIQLISDFSFLKPIQVPKQQFSTIPTVLRMDTSVMPAASIATLSDASFTNKRIVILDGYDNNNVLPEHRDLVIYPSTFTDNTQLYGLLDSSDGSDERIHTMEIRPPYTQGECVPMADWQTTFHPVCNGMHELDMASYENEKSDEKFQLFGKNGFWRNAWRYDHKNVGHDETIVLKTLKINHRFEDNHFEHNRIDAVVLERLTASPHVIDIFGFCGHSVLTEYADGKRLGELADKNKKVPLSRLKIALDIASGLADVHGIDGDEHPSFVHLDINPANVVSIGGTLKLNDFNIGILRRWNTTSHEPCGIPAQYPNPQWRSPEEARGENNLTEKVDVFSMGHIFFRLICGHEPWNKLEPGGMPSKPELNDKVMNGELPTVPHDVIISTEPEVVAIREAMYQCYRYDPQSRPSARAIAEKLRESLAIISRQGGAGTTTND